MCDVMSKELVQDYDIQSSEMLHSTDWSYLPTFRDSLSVPTSRVWQSAIRLKGRPETLVTDY
jgi:hypothetical protein